MIISFLGTLPFSTLNITAIQISIQENVHNALSYSVGTLVAEMILVRIALVGINWVRKQKVILKWFEWISVIIIVAFAIGSFIAGSKGTGAKNVMLNNNMNRFILGMMMSTLNPMHVPFWFAWSTVLFTKKLLKPGELYYNIYVFAIGLGTFLANCIFIFGGKIIVKQFYTNQNVLNWILGAIFVLTALIQLVKILWHKDALEKLRNINKEFNNKIQ